MCKGPTKNELGSWIKDDIRKAHQQQKHRVFAVESVNWSDGINLVLFYAGAVLYSVVVDGLENRFEVDLYQLNVLYPSQRDNAVCPSMLYQHEKWNLSS
jgi:hypothetical protein